MMEQGRNAARPNVSGGLHLVPPPAPPLRSIAELPGPKGRPIMGSARDINSTRFHQVLENWGREFGALYKFSVLRRTLVVTSDRDVIATLLRDRPDVMRRSSRTSRMLEEAGTKGLFTAEGEQWRRERKLAMRALTPEVIHNFFPKLRALTERLRRRCAPSRPICSRRWWPRATKTAPASATKSSSAMPSPWCLPARTPHPTRWRG